MISDEILDSCSDETQVESVTAVDENASNVTRTESLDPVQIKLEEAEYGIRKSIMDEMSKKLEAAKTEQGDMIREYIEEEISTKSDQDNVALESIMKEMTCLENKNETAFQELKAKHENEKIELQDQIKDKFLLTVDLLVNLHSHQGTYTSRYVYINVRII